MKYDQYNVQDFLQDEYFVQWVTNPDSAADHFWEKWLQNNPDQTGIAAEARQMINAVDYREHFTLSDGDYTEMLEGVLKGKRISSKTDSSPKAPHTLHYHWIGWAAAIALLVMSVYGLFSEKPEVVEQPVAVSWVVKETLKGQKNNLKLGDGTLVKLNAGTRFRFPEKFQKNKRVVYLEGEAFFEVAEDANRPFTVISSNVSTTALGTSFNVKSGADNIKVALVTGKVKVEDNTGSSLILAPNEMVIYAGGQVTKGKFDYNEEIAWRDGSLYFNQKPLKDVFATLENWYGVEVESIGQLTGNYTGQFEGNPSLDKVLEGISFATGLTYEKNDSTILIKN